MKLEDLKRYEPIFGSWYIKREIGRGNYGAVYEVERNEFGYTYKSALKAISIPRDEAERQQVINSLGAESSVSYFKSIAEGFNDECLIMAKLKGSTNIVGYEDHLVIKRGVMDWDILIRMELLTPLYEYMKSHALGEDDVIRLGRDICNALTQCGNIHLIHRDIKPENIFVTEFGVFKLGHFGSASMMEKTLGASSKIGSYDYMAPEVYWGEKNYDARVDTYSLGLVMYRLLNDNRMPFMPPAPEPVTFRISEEAKQKRYNGHSLPAPANGSDSLKRAVLMACSFDPDARFNSPKEFEEALGMIARSGVWQKSDTVSGHRPESAPPPGKEESTQAGAGTGFRSDNAGPAGNDKIKNSEEMEYRNKSSHNRPVYEDESPEEDGRSNNRNRKKIRLRTVLITILVACLAWAGGRFLGEFFALGIDGMLINKENSQTVNEEGDSKDDSTVFTLQDLAGYYSGDRYVNKVFGYYFEKPQWDWVYASEEGLERVNNSSFEETIGNGKVPHVMYADDHGRQNTQIQIGYINGYRTELKAEEKETEYERIKNSLIGCYKDYKDFSHTYSSISFCGKDARILNCEYTDEQGVKQRYAAIMMIKGRVISVIHISCSGAYQIDWILNYYKPA